MKKRSKRRSLSNPAINKIIRKPISRRSILRDGLLSLSFVPFIGCGGSSSGGSSITPISSQTTPGELTANGNIQSVIIVGAGISGLIAAYELSRVGHQVVVLEARERNGGRVNTLRSPFSEGEFAEAGASRIPSNHSLTISYSNHFDLVMDRFYPDSGNYFNLVGDTATFIDNSQYINSPPWPGSVNRSSYTKIRGGMSNLPNAFASFLGNDIVYSQPVSLIVQDDNGVSVTTEDGSVYFADRVLCTVPLPVLSNIDFSPALSSQKIEASTGGYHYTDSSRLFTQFSSRFWTDTGLNAWGDTDFPEEIWQPTWDASGSNAIVQSYLRGEAAEQFDLLSLSQQIDQLHTRWRNVLTDLDEHILTSHVHSWANEPWSGSAFASPTVKQASGLAEHIGLAEGRIHFAGEHASGFHGWIQGALESGIRVAAEIHASA